MNTTNRTSTAERIGRSIGRGWRTYARGEQQLSTWLISKRGSAFGVTSLLWAIKLTLLGLLFYLAFWFAVVLLGVVVATWVAAANIPDEEEEWLFTDLTELRKTPGYDPNMYNDTSHELYTDD